MNKELLLAMVIDQCIKQGMSIDETSELFSKKMIAGAYKILNCRIKS